MNYAREKFLLSFCYGLAQLNTLLSRDEKEVLKNVADQLGDQLENEKNEKNEKNDLEKSTAWEEYTELNLTEIINNNSSLKTIFYDIKSKVDNIDNIPQDLIPNYEELATVIPTINRPQERSIPNISRADFKSNEITNISIQILSSSEPLETVKNIPKLQKLWNFISQNNSENK